MAISIVCKSGEPAKKRRKLKEGLNGTKNDDGINRCLLVLITPGNKESHELATHYLRGMGFVPGEWLVCCDLKVINIFVGMMAHSCRFPCFICVWRQGSEDDEAPLRTFEGMQAARDAWVEAGSDPLALKFFQCCRDVAVEIFPRQGFTKHYIALSSVHILLGIVNGLSSGAEIAFPGFSDFLAKLHIRKSAYHGQAFEGRECHKILNVGLLREMVSEANHRVTRQSASAERPPHRRLRQRAG